MIKDIYAPDCSVPSLLKYQLEIYMYQENKMEYEDLKKHFLSIMVSGKP